MFFRLLFVAILAYFIFRSIGNLIRAARGEAGNPQRMQARETGPQFDIRSTPESRQSPSNKSGGEAHAHQIGEDIEDARWTDVS